MTNIDSKYMTVSTAAKTLGVSESTIRRYGERKYIKVWRDPKSRNRRRAFLAREILDLAEKLPK